MIKKISRPKQVNNQDKQAPKTIQELMQRYDLDNKEICDYLDYLIEHLIQEKQELNKKIETNTDNIKNKVSKSGDTMTGDLILDNGRFLDGIDSNGNQMHLIRAYNGMVAPGHGNYPMRLFSKSDITAWINGTVKTLATKEQKVLWRATGGAYMNASQTAQLSEKISEQNNGIVLFFQPYSNGAPQNWGYYCKYIPKQAIATYGSGYGYNFVIPSNTKGIIATKYLYINDDYIAGNADNVKTFTIFGTSVNNMNAVLTAVFGV